MRIKRGTKRSCSVPLLAECELRVGGRAGKVTINERGETDIRMEGNLAEQLTPEEWNIAYNGLQTFLHEMILADQVKQSG